LPTLARYGLLRDGDEVVIGEFLPELRAGRLLDISEEEEEEEWYE
jgi:hypothetical protein